MLKIINYLLFLLQTKYRRLRHGKERVDLKHAFFHQGNSKKRVMQRFKQTLDKIGLKYE
jgi:hypothetical protein